MSKSKQSKKNTLYLAIDQYGKKTLLNSITYKNLKKVFFAGSIHLMYQDDKNGNSHKVGYILGQGAGYESLWLTIYTVTPAFQEVTK